jgi:hypothetical protein
MQANTETRFSELPIGAKFSFYRDHIRIANNIWLKVSETLAYNSINYVVQSDTIIHPTGEIDWKTLINYHAARPVKYYATRAENVL